VWSANRAQSRPDASECTRFSFQSPVLAAAGSGKVASVLTKEDSLGSNGGAITAGNRPGARLCFAAACGRLQPRHGMIRTGMLMSWSIPGHVNAQAANILQTLDPADLCFPLNVKRLTHCLGNDLSLASISDTLGLALK
jgi:hypothetical protein